MAFSNEAARKAWFSLASGINDLESRRQAIDVGQAVRGSVHQAAEIEFQQPDKAVLQGTPIRSAITRIAASAQGRY